MVLLLFNTYEHTLEVNFVDNLEKYNYTNVTTIKTHEEGFYEVLQRQESSGKNTPLYRFPIDKTIIKFVHEEGADF
jgi:hypothetical protein|tara:strand:+ start:114 stop:341 length:228 start_codon:yes stop_codon:yes gene_type:complete